MNANTSFLYRAIAVLAFAQTATLFGCDDSQAPKPTVPVAPRAGAGGAAGSAGQAGRGGSGGRAAAPAAPKPVPCGSVTCELSTIQIAGLTPLAPCCVAASEGTCGWMNNMTGMCVAPPPVDPDCPPSANDQNGCCVSETDRCGVDATVFGAGCFELAGSMWADPANNPARTCDGVLAEEDDAGVDDSDGGLLEPEPGAGSGGAGGTAGGSGGAGGTGGSVNAGSGGSAGSAGRSARGVIGGRGALPGRGRG